jgi:hypothetical protein
MTDYREGGELTSVGMAKRELKRYAKYTRKIRRLEEDIQEKKERITSARSAAPNGISVQTSEYDSMGDAIADILDQEYEALVVKRTALKDKQSAIEGYIAELEDPYDSILEVRYTGSYRTLRECVKDLGYDYHYLICLHGKALQVYANYRGFSKKYDN